MHTQPFIRKATKSFDTGEGIKLPKNIFSHQIDERYLFIAPEKASFITTNAFGKEFLNYFREGYSIQGVIDAMKEKGIEMDRIVSELHTFLVKVERKGFYEDAVVTEIKNTVPVLHIDITNKCNISCTHCFQDAGKPRENELSTAEWLKVIEDFSSLYKKSRITFSGGEPLLHPGIFDILTLAKSKEVTVVLFSNGTLITDEQMVSKLEKCVDKLQLSLDGATEDINDGIRGKGVFKKVLHAFKLLQKTSISLDLAISIMPQNKDSFSTNVEKIVAEIGSGVDIRIGSVMKAGRATKSHLFASDAESKMEVRKIISDIYKKKLKNVSPEDRNIKLCNCGYGESIVISSIGDVYPCNVYESRVKIGNCRERNFTEMAKDIEILREMVSVENIDGCCSCDLRYMCFGGCRLNNVYRKNNVLISGCTPEFKKNLYSYIAERDDNFDPLAMLMDESCE